MADEKDKAGLGRHIAILSRSPTQQQVFINGVDVSCVVKSVTVSVDAGCLPQVTLICSPLSLELEANALVRAEMLTIPRAFAHDQNQEEGAG